MANISIAEGYLDIKGSAKSITSFLQLMERARVWNHSLKIHVGYFDKKQLHETMNENPDKQMDVNYRFTGFGRWEFENNLQDLMQNIVRERNTSPSLNDIGQRVRLDHEKGWKVYEEIAWSRLDKQPITLTFNYVDVEPGMERVYDVSATIQWDKNDLINAKLTEVHKKSCPFEAEAIYEIDYAQQHQIFDATSFTVESINDNLDYYDFDWLDYLTHYYYDVNLDLTDIGDLSSKRHKEFITQLGEQFDKIKEENPDKIQTYIRIEDWYLDPIVKDTIIEILSA